MNKIADLAYWITERYSVKLRKESGLPTPWSADPVFQTTRFCNVHREDDAVTRWIRNSGWYSAPTVPVWRVVMARMFNYVPVLEALKEFDSLEMIADVLKTWRNAGEKIFSSAYTITTCGQKMDKIDYVMDVVARVRTCDNGTGWDFGSCIGAHADLMQVDGLGSFLAAQVVADLKNTPGHPLARAPDFWTFSAPGPGSLKGLAEYFGENVTPATYHAKIEQAWAEVSPLIPDYVPRISMQDFQNCLCEFSKYQRVRAGGHARNRYMGQAAERVA